MVAIGHLIGYATGTINLVKIFGKTLGDTQFKQLCIISATTLLLAVGITSYSVGERILITRRFVASDTSPPTVACKRRDLSFCYPPKCDTADFCLSGYV
jgi:solute carrier family 45 protein 1/2/4